MKVTNLKGLAIERPVHRQIAVAAGVKAPSAQRRSFQAKFTTADEQLRRKGSDAKSGISNKRLTRQSENPVRTASAKTSNSPQIPRNKRSNARGPVQAKELSAVSAAASRRIRRFRKLTPRELRERVLQITTDLSLNIVDIRTDTSNHSVTLVVDQPGYSKTQLVIECEDSAWQVSIRAEANCDVEGLLTEEQALQVRFSKARLGLVFVKNPPTDARTK